MFTVSDVQKNRYACFMHMEDHERKAQIGAVEYIERMAALTNTDITTVNLFDAFGNGVQKDRLLISKGELNKRIFELGKKESVKSRDLSDFDMNVLKSISGRSQTLIRNRITNMKSDVRSLISSGLATYSRYEDYIRQAAEMNVVIRDLEKRTQFDFVEEVRKVMASTFWELSEEGFAPGRLTFITKSDVILTQKNPAAGIDFRVNLGRFKAVYNVDYVRIELFTHKDNMSVVGGYYHPYVSTSGKICWGNASAQATEYISSYKLSEAMELLAGLLTTYSPETTPYVELRSFQEELDRKNGKLPQEEERCETCDSPTDDCECYYCERCDARYEDGRCSEHYCSVCDSHEYGRCGCCYECEQDSDNCNCCGICESTDRDECGCCQECDRSAGRIQDEGHYRSCPARSPE